MGIAEVAAFEFIAGVKRCLDVRVGHTAEGRIPFSAGEITADGASGDVRILREAEVEIVIWDDAGVALGGADADLLGDVAGEDQYGKDRAGAVFPGGPRARSPVFGVVIFVDRGGDRIVIAVVGGVQGQTGDDLALNPMNRR